MRFGRIATDYEITGARFQSSKRVLEILDTLGRVEATPWYIVDRLRRRYQTIYEQTQHQLDLMAEQYPEFINDIQSRSAQGLLLTEELESIANEVRQGALPHAVADQMTEEIAEELRALKSHEIARLKLEPIELLRTVSFFQDISLEDIANIAIRMKLEKVAEGRDIMKQGEPGEHIFFIGHGVVRVSRVERGVSRDLATLMAGDYFGEDALLTQEPRNATVTAVTECTLYKLHREDLEVAMALQPAIRKALAKESQKWRARHVAG
jgi:CPA1 family monovalent cation:H+ antiporter